MVDETKELKETKEVKLTLRQQQQADMELEMQKLLLEEKRLSVLDLKERVDERKMKRDTKDDRSRSNGNVLRQNAAVNALVQAQCNHKKGGNGAEGIIQGRGDDPQYAVLKHRFGNGDIWVRCLRCGKTWKPVLEEDHTVEGVFNKEAFAAAVNDYNAAVSFQTRNVMSGSIPYQFSDGGKHFRQVMKNTDLR